MDLEGILREEDSIDIGTDAPTLDEVLSTGDGQMSKEVCWFVFS
jgi:hypothetical protein